MDGQFWVDLVGEIIIARIRGEMTVPLLEQLSNEVVQIAQKTGKNRVLIDVLEMSPPPVEIPMIQWKLNEQQKALGLRRAIVVPNSRLAYLARLSFAETDNQIFYGDLVAAIQWLTKDTKE